MCKQKFSTLRKWLLSGEMKGEKQPLLWKNEGCHWLRGQKRGIFPLKACFATDGIIQDCFVWMEVRKPDQNKILPLWGLLLLPDIGDCHVLKFPGLAIGEASKSHCGQEILLVRP